MNTFRDRLEQALKMRDMTPAELSRATGIKESAISQYRRGAYKATQKNLELIANALNVSIPWLMGISDNITPRKDNYSVSAKALTLAKTFDALDQHGQRVVSALAAEELARVDAEKEVPKKTIPLMENRLAAGYADPDFDNGTSEYEIPATVHADFAIHVHGTSMEPYLHDGDIALGINRKPKHGEIGAFLLNGEYLVKQYITDHLGNVYLLSLNRKEADKDIYLMKDNRDYFELWTFGAIITDKKIPLPKV